MSLVSLTFSSYYELPTLPMALSGPQHPLLASATGKQPRSGCVGPT